MAPLFLLANCPDLPATTWVARIMTYRTGAGSPGMGQTVQACSCQAQRTRSCSASCFKPQAMSECSLGR